MQMYDYFSVFQTLKYIILQYFRAGKVKRISMRNLEAKNNSTLIGIRKSNIDVRILLHRLF